MSNKDEQIFNEEDIQGLWKTLARIGDASTPNALTRSELGALLARLKIRADEASIDAFFDKIDKNHDREISFDEFAAFCRVRESELLEIFREVDTDGDGRLTESEIFECLQRRDLKPDRGTISAYLARADADNDGGLSYTEFRELAMMFPTIGVAAVFDKATEGSIGYYSIPKSEAGEDVSKRKHPFVVLASGGVAGLISRTLTAPADRIKVMTMALSSAGVAAQSSIYPMEVVKTRLAVATPGTYKGVVDCLLQSVRSRGVSSLYAGIQPSILGIVPYAGIDLAVYGTIRDAWVRRHPNASPSDLTVLCMGAFSSFCGQIVAYPLQLPEDLSQLKAHSNGFPNCNTFRFTFELMIRRESRIRKYGILEKLRKNDDNDAREISLCDACTGTLVEELKDEIEDSCQVLQRYENFTIAKRSRDEILIDDQEYHDRKRTLSSGCGEKTPSPVDESRAPRSRRDTNVDAQTHNIVRALEGIRDASAQHERIAEMRDGLLRQIEATDAEIKRLKHVSVLNDSVFIWYEKSFGTVSGFRLGSLPPYNIVEASEINAACGELAMLLIRVAKELDVRFSSCRFVEIGCASYVVESSSSTAARRHNFFLDRVTGKSRESAEGEGDERGRGESDASRMCRYSNIASFNRAMRCVCKCVGELAKEIETRNERELASEAHGQDKSNESGDIVPSLRLPYPVLGDGTIGGYSTEIPADQDESKLRVWTKSMRLLLTDIKFLVAQTQQSRRRRLQSKGA
eukprot:g4007.t1